MGFQTFWRRYWMNLVGAVGFSYQFTTLSLMLANDILSEHDTRMWGGYFPWWTVFFTFTFWSNFFLLICYLWYTISRRVRRNHTFLYICACYITLVLIVVAFALFPAAVVAHNSVSFKHHVSSLSYAALIMPHAPGPVLFITYSFIIFNFSKRGNYPVVGWGWGRDAAFLLAFFLPYMIMVIALNWIPIGAYVFQNGTKVFLPGFSVYSLFTDLNPHLLYTAGHDGAPWRIIFFIVGFLILGGVHTLYYNVLKYGIMGEFLQGWLQFRDLSP